MKAPCEFEYLWSTLGGRYALVRCVPGDDSELLPFNIETQSAVLIEDDELANYVIQRMLAAGLPIVDPPRNPI